MSEKRTTNFCSLKIQRYYKPHVRKADYKSQKADTTNFCSVKKHILQTCLVDGISKFCSLKSNFCILSVNFVVFV